MRNAFDATPQAPLVVKGHADAVRTFLIEGPRRGAFDTEARGVEGIETRMVGRSAELGLLQAALRTAITESRGRMLVIVGEAGVGKTRLAREFERWAEREPHRPDIWKGRATVTTLATPHGLLRDVLARRFEILDSDSAALARDRFEAGVLAAFPNDAAATMRAHLVGQLLGFDFSDSPHVRGALADAREVHDRARSYLADYFRATTSDGPALVILEDLHWADDSSFEALPILVDVVRDRPVLFVGTARPELDERRPGWTESRPAIRRLTLPPLSTAASRELVLEILQKADEVPDALRDLVVTTAEGNPFFAEELVKMLLEDGVIERQTSGRGSWHVVADRVSAARVPPSLTGVLQARLDRLEPIERTILQQASVIGRSFWDRAVFRLAEAAGGSTDTTAVGAALAALQRKELVFERETSAFGGCREFTFKHALLHDVAYQGLLRRQRRIYHGAAADWLIEMGGDRAPEISGLVGSHLELAGRPADAAAQLGRAAARAAATFANEEAIRFYGRALELAGGGAAGSPERRFAVTLAEGLGDVLHLVGRHQAARDAYGEALSKLGQEDALGAARLLRKRANSWVAERAFAAAEEAFQRAALVLGTAPDAGDAAAGAGAGAGGPNEDRLGWWREWIGLQNDWMLAYYWQARVDDLDALVTRTRPAVERYGTPPQRAGFFQALMMLDYRLYRYLLPDVAVEHASAYLAASQEAGDPGPLAFARFLVGFTFLWHGDLAAAEEQLVDALELAERSGAVTAQARCLTYLTVLHRERGELERVRALIQPSLQVASVAGMPEYMATARANEAWVAWRDGDFDAVGRCGTAALELWPPVHASSSFRWTALWPLIGVALARNDTEAAVDHLRALLHPSQQRLADDLLAPAEAAVRAWDDGDAAAARRHLDDAAAISRTRGGL